MAIDTSNYIYLYTLLTTIESTKKRFILDRLFGNMKGTFASQIAFSVEYNEAGMATLNYIDNASKSVSRPDKSLKTFGLVYTSEHKFLSGNDMLTPNGFGNVIMPPEVDLSTLHDNQVADDMLRLKDRVLNLREYMAWRYLLGSMNLTHQSVNYAFDLGLPGAVTPTLVDGARWSESTATILKDLWSWSRLIGEYGGGTGVDVIMGDDVANLIISNDDIMKALDNNNYAIGRLDIKLLEASTHIGSLGQLNLWAETKKYRDYSGASQYLLPADKLVMLGSDMDSAYYYGPVPTSDGPALFEMLPEIIPQKDPAGSKQMLQSRGIPIVHNYGSWIVADVK